MKGLEIHAKHEFNLNDADLMKWDIEALHLLFNVFQFWGIIAMNQNSISSCWSLRVVVDSVGTLMVFQEYLHLTVEVVI